MRLYNFDITVLQLEHWQSSDKCIPYTLMQRMSYILVPLDATTSVPGRGHGAVGARCSAFGGL